MQFLYEIFPVFLFFIAFKYYGIYTATAVGIVTTLLQLLATRLWSKQWDKKQLITFVVFVVMGSMTFYFHNPIFVKWKPTLIYWIFATVLLATQLFTPKPLMQRMMENVLQDKGNVPAKIWKQVNLAWALFFLVLGVVNLYIAYYYTNDAWVNFKFFGVTAALVVFCLLQALYLARFLDEKK